MRGEFRKISGELHVKILVFIIVIVSILMAVLPINSFSAIKSADDSSLVKGKEAIALEKERYKNTRGELSLDKMQEALTYYQSIPSADLAYAKSEMEYPGVTSLLFKAYTNSGVEAELFSVEGVEDFYERNVIQIDEKIKQNPYEYTDWEKEEVIKRAGNIEEPYNLDYTRQWTFAFKSIGILFIVISIAAFLIGAGVFSYEREKKMNLVLTTLNKRKICNIGKNKIKAFLTIISGMFLISVTFFSVAFFAIVGISGWNCPIQIEYFTAINKVNFAQAYFLVVLMGWVSLLVIGMISMTINALLQTSYSTLVIGGILIFSPVIVERLGNLPIWFDKVVRSQPINGLMPEKILSELHVYKVFATSMSPITMHIMLALVLIILLWFLASRLFVFRINKK